MKRSARFVYTIALLLAACALVAWAATPTSPDTSADSWPYYGHDAGGMRYSPLTQINRDNVAQLKVAWTFHTGDVSESSGRRKRSGFETTPLLVDGTLYLTTAFNRIIALDPETGKQRWAYDPKIDLDGDYGDGLVNRGVAAWLDSARNKDKPCHHRIFESTQDARLVAVDAANGAPCADFGKDGIVSLRDVLQYDAGWYHMTSPPAIIDDLVVVGSAIDDNHRVDMARGVVRAYDARSGVLRWSWDPLPPNPAAAAAEGKGPSWRSGAGNAWSIMAVDQQRDLLFVPTGSASPDYYGGLRPGDDKWSNSVVALRGKTGELVWGFQLVHHDLWDFDTAAPPLLTTLHLDGKDVPVVIQGNKSGLLYVLNRDTGKPVFPVEERPVPKSDVPGEVASPTQPFPVKPAPLAPHTLSADQAWGATPEDRDWCRTYISKLRNGGIYTPPSLQGTLMVPGNIGGMTWSGYAFDPEHSLLVTNTNNIAAIARLIPRERYNDRSSHTEDGDYGDQLGSPYGLYRRFIQSPSDLPCSPPPWGYLTAVDLAEGRIRWQAPLGSMQDFGSSHPQPIPPGSISLGGPIVTAGGLVFIAGTTDCNFRAFDIETGKELWKAALPACGNATPMTYRLSTTGKQYLVIAAGGHPKITEEKLGDSLVAFTLPWRDRNTRDVITSPVAFLQMRARDLLLASLQGRMERSGVRNLSFYAGVLPRFYFAPLYMSNVQTQRGTHMSNRHHSSWPLFPALCASLCLAATPIAQQSNPSNVETGYVATSDGVRLYYAKVGNGSQALILPGRLFLFRDFQRLAKGRTLIFYDMRNRGLSNAVSDPSKISLQHDTDDLEAVRAHFGIEKPDLIGFSYLGKIVILYATEHPDHVNRIVQIGPVARRFGTQFPKVLTAGDADKVPDPAEEKKLDELFKNGFAKDHPKEYCEMEWKIEQQRMVGNPANTNRIASPCDMENEWPIHLFAHFDPLLASDKALDIPKEAIAKITAPVLTIHGRKDRNAPYGGGREWDMLLPNARLITIDGAAHLSWVEFPEIVFPAIDQFLNGNCPDRAEIVKTLEPPPRIPPCH